MTFGVYVVQRRPIGWGGMASPTASTLVVARSEQEAERQAVAVWGIDPSLIADRETAREHFGRGDSVKEAGLWDHWWLASGRLDPSDPLPLTSTKLGTLLAAAAAARDLNAVAA